MPSGPTHYHVARPHVSLREPVAELRSKCREHTPVMTTGLTDWVLMVGNILHTFLIPVVV